jgi:hypothetical protein
VGGQSHASAALPPAKTRYPLDTRAGLDMCGKSRPTLGFDPRTVQPVASRYTVYTIPAHYLRRCMVRNVLGRTSTNGDLYQTERCRRLDDTVRSTTVAKRRGHQRPDPFVIPTPCPSSPTVHNTSRPINSIFNCIPYYCVVPL